MEIRSVVYGNGEQSMLVVNGDLHVPWPCSTWYREPIEAWLAEGNEIGDFVPPPEPRRVVPKSVVIERLTDAQLDAALAAMTPRQRERWRSPDSPFVYADDEEVVGLIRAIGADPAVVLAPPER